MNIDQKVKIYAKKREDKDCVQTNDMKFFFFFRGRNDMEFDGRKNH